MLSSFTTYGDRGREEWELAGGSGPGQRFEIEPGVNVWDYSWWEEPGGELQVGDSPTGPFRYLKVHGFQAQGRRIVFAVEIGHWDSYTFYRRVYPS